MFITSIKPHHLLDICKLIGRGIERFVPDPAYGHNFYRVANGLLDRGIESVQFTVGADAICLPCRFCKEGRCCDTMTLNGIEAEKDDFNRAIDSRLLSLLHLTEGEAYSVNTLLPLLQENLSLEIVQRTWDSASPEDQEQRYRGMAAGLGRLCELQK